VVSAARPEPEPLPLPPEIVNPAVLTIKGCSLTPFNLLDHGLLNDYLLPQPSLSSVQQPSIIRSTKLIRVQNDAIKVTIRVNKQRTIIAPNSTVRIVVPAQADTDANVIATKDFTLIFHYMPYDTPEPVEVFAESADIHAVG